LRNGIFVKKKYIKSEKKHGVLLSLGNTQHAQECMRSLFSSCLIQPVNSFFSDTWMYKWVFSFSSSKGCNLF